MLLQPEVGAAQEACAGGLKQAGELEMLREEVNQLDLNGSELNAPVQCCSRGTRCPVREMHKWRANGEQADMATMQLSISRNRSPGSQTSSGEVQVPR